MAVGKLWSVTLDCADPSRSPSSGRSALGGKIAYTSENFVGVEIDGRPVDRRVPRSTATQRRSGPTARRRSSSTSTSRSTTSTRPSEPSLALGAVKAGAPARARPVAGLPRPRRAPVLRHRRWHEHGQADARPGARLPGRGAGAAPRRRRRRRPRRARHRRAGGDGAPGRARVRGTAARDREAGPTDVAVGPGHRLALAWTLRGAPHVHRRATSTRSPRALWPLSEADAAGRLNETGPSVKRAGIPALEQFEIAVDAMRAVVTTPDRRRARPAPRSRARLPKPMRRDCRPCKTRHISDSAMRSAALAGRAGDRAGHGAAGAAPPQGRQAARTAPDPRRCARWRIAYLRCLGPATRRRVRRLPRGAAGRRRGGLVRRRPGRGVGRRAGSAWLPEDCLDAAAQGARARSSCACSARSTRTCRPATAT